MKTIEIKSIDQLQTEISKLLSENSILKQSNAYLEEQLEWLKRQIFGKKSEKIISTDSSNQLILEGFDALEKPFPEEMKKITAHTRKIPKREGQNAITFPADLPVERKVLDLSEKEKICPETKKPLIKIGEEITRKLAFKPGSFYIKEIVRPKYALPKGTEAGIRIAELPDSFIPKCRVDESLLAEILTKKFVDHLPLYRISEGLTREGICISRQLLSQWVVRIGKELKPLYDVMLKKILESKNVFVDETPIDLQVKGKGKHHQGYMWVIVGGKGSDPPYRIYQFHRDRKHHRASDLLKNYRGVLHSDKYGAYEKLANEKQILWSPCWSHIRRKFFEAEGDKEFREWVLMKIRHLYLLERVAWNNTEEERLRIRKEKEIPLIDELTERIKTKLLYGKSLPKSKFRIALGYYYSLIPHLKNYTKSADARLDNNVAERAIRPLAIGRKNWMFVGSEDGGKAAGVIYSLVQTCRALKINPREYLEDLLRRFMSHGINNLEELLPHHCSENNPSE